VRENAFMHILGGIVWGPKYTFLGGFWDVMQSYPLKPHGGVSRWESSFSFECLLPGIHHKIGEFLVCLTSVTVTLLMVSLSLITQSHLSLISSFDRCFPWMTLSHLSTHMRYADLESIICWRQDGPTHGAFFVRQLSFLSLILACIDTAATKDRSKDYFGPGEVPVWRGCPSVASDLPGVLWGFSSCFGCISLSHSFLGGVLFYVCYVGALWGSR